MDSSSQKPVIVIGGGPAGLTAAYQLKHDNGIDVVVLEKLDKVGGIARTENYKGYYFDMGGHRFFTKSVEVNAFWDEVLKDDFLNRPRLSRIYYNNKFFNYPLKPLNTLLGLGPIEAVRIILSYIRWQLFPYREEESFEQWVTNRFGRRLFQTFFKSYTEKVWGIPCSELKAEWAAQRIKDLSLRSAITSMFIKPGKSIKTLIDEFQYPRRGPGMLWTMVKEQIEEQGGDVRLNSDVQAIYREGKRITGVEIQNGSQRYCLEGSAFISSMPVTQFLQWLNPPPPNEVLAAADQLKYRDFLTVCLIINQKESFPDNWVYIHEPDVHVGRIQNFKNWSPEMVPDPNKTSLGLEYFCNEGDDLWSMADEDLIELGKREIDRIGLARYEDIEDGVVFRVEKTYPVYDSDYKQALEVIKNYTAGLENFQTIGRNGLHRYNNQDHAMLTGMYAVRNLLEGESFDLWQINAEEEYHEIIYEDERVQIDDVVEMVQQAMTHVFSFLDPVSFGLSVGTVSAVSLFLATWFLIFKGGDVVGPNLTLLNQFFLGYSVTPIGSLVGFLYAGLAGFILGWGVTSIRNLIVAFYLSAMYRSAERSILGSVIDLVSPDLD